MRIKDEFYLTPPVVGGVGEKKSNSGTQYFQQDRVYSCNYIAMCHPACIPGGSYLYLIGDYNERDNSNREA